jgi:hypothetical protein
VVTVREVTDTSKIPNRLILIQRQCCGKIPGMVEKEDVPEYLPISPVTLPCPTCEARPGEACGTGFQLEFVHLARIKVAAKLDQANYAQPN